MFQESLLSQEELRRSLSSARTEVADVERRLAEQTDSNTKLTSALKSVRQELAANRESAAVRVRLETRVSELEAALAESTKAETAKVASRDRQIAALESEGAEHERQIGQLQERNRQLGGENAEYLETVFQLRAENDEMKRIALENAGLKGQVDELQSSLSALSGERELLNGRIGESAALKNENEGLREQCESLKNRVSELSADNARVRKQIEESDADAKVEKLQLRIDELVQQDLCKQVVIDELQAKIDGFGSPRDPAEVEQLQLRMSELERELEMSEPSAELAKKNRKLARMIEKSNRLYAEMVARNQVLEGELERQKQKTNDFTFAVQQPVFISPAAASPGPGGPVHDDSHVMNAYLKRVMLQFFLQDETKRDSLIPMILKLVGCTDQQIATAQRQWARSRTFLPASLFGMGK
jgi:chromosome segregation ATPase